MNTAKLSPAAAQTRGALAVYLRPKLAKDTAIDFDPILKGVTAKTFKSQVPAMVLGVQKATKGHLAKDADIEDVAEVIEALAEILPPETEAEVKAAVEGETGGEVGEDDDALKAKLEAAGVPAEVIAKVMAEMGSTPDTATDEKDGDKDKKDKAMDAALRLAMKKMVPQTALDAAIARNKADIARVKAETIAETTAHINGIADARRRVAPWVGELAMDFDSIEAVERKACDVLGIAHKGKHPDSLWDIISDRPKAGERPRGTAPRQAHDSAPSTGFHERFPGAARISNAV